MALIIGILIIAIAMLVAVPILAIAFNICEKRNLKVEPTQEVELNQDKTFTANDARKIQENARIERNKRIQQMREDNKFKMLINEILQKISEQAAFGYSYLHINFRFRKDYNITLFEELCQNYSIGGIYLECEIAEELRSRGFTVERGAKEYHAWIIRWEALYKDLGF